MNNATRYDTDTLIALARAAARADEERHRANNPVSSSTQANERTLLGWGGAALLDIEWVGKCQFEKPVKDEFRRAYLDEYVQRRAARTQAG